jgi:hypothetical protein
MGKTLKAKFMEEKKVFEIEMTKGQTIEIASSGLFDNERELMAWAHNNGAKALGYYENRFRLQPLLYQSRVADLAGRVFQSPDVEHGVGRY